MFVTKTQELSDFCKKYANADYITIDTEFMRERTYWPKLCLVQLAGGADVIAVDPLAQGMDLTPLYELLANPKVTKVFHAARQDIEIFVNLTGKVPQNVFDTQVAGMVCGFGESVSYENLVSSLVGEQIDKSSRFTDWSNRPLSEKQITYALGDVSHLRVVYEKLRAMLEKTNRQDWVKEEMAVLTSEATYKIDPREVWRKFKWRADKPRIRALLRELAAWREEEAQRLDVPRNRVIRDEALMEIAYHPPQNGNDLSRIRGLSTSFANGKQGSGVLAAVARGQAVPHEECPTGEKRRVMPAGAGAVMDLLRVLLKQVSDESNVAVKLLATTDDLEAIASEDKAQVPAMQGWRYDLFGQKAEELKTGKISLAIRDKKIVILPLA